MKVIQAPQPVAHFVTLQQSLTTTVAEWVDKISQRLANLAEKCLTYNPKMYYDTSITYKDMTSQCKLTIKESILEELQRFAAESSSPMLHITTDDEIKHKKETFIASHKLKRRRQQ